mmetsp:Transcript_32482/g.52616  ORF Transcript_32482/g.52616 Transcript_32482/m.52616 type:complete len:240 (+) Transcript_32482:121-840(+)|eukprot:CAMPEP_0184655130 /NCGR_PEP_ID=MMETSP0308-20130426/12746_1 /TAXON_ID=38269 /ORGANISM="Gloeochaete witrockiana, Strain SAG 46.84" /LENGTH=239 /DNA_ID=CAMNT_0027091409 /DNA_START=35 /DNA_END=754 /DNA_ORIENTATION=-
MSLVGKIILVFGGSGNVGNGAIHAFLAQQATVVAPTRKAATAEKLRAQFKGDNFFPIVGDVSSARDAEAIRDEVIKKHGSIDHVISSSGPWWNAPPLHEIDPALYDEIYRSNYLAHFLIYRTFLPSILEKKGSSFTFVTGAAGEMPGSGITGLFAANLFDLAKWAMFQSKPFPVRVNELRIGMRIDVGGINTESHASSETFGTLFPLIALNGSSAPKSETLAVGSATKFKELSQKLKSA